MADVQWIDGSPGAWVGTPLGDFSGWIGVGKTTLGELSANAAKASIAIKSSGSIITRQGSLLDVSGGSVRYQDGWITTTKLRGADGRIYDIGAGDAEPALCRFRRLVLANAQRAGNHRSAADRDLARPRSIAT
jgi:hypothetical protein